MASSRRLFPPLAASTTILILLAITGKLCHGFPSSSAIITTNNNLHRRQETHLLPALVATSSKTALSMMEIMDYFREIFLDSRDGDFVPLEDDTAFAGQPSSGPLILMYAVPDSIDDEELQEMVQDGMPQRVVVVREGSDSTSGVVIRRILGMDENGLGGDALLDASVGEALDMVMGGKTSSSNDRAIAKSEQVGPCPVIYFSGVSNAEMMETYQIIAKEIFQETNGRHWPACAKVVQPAMEKSLRTVLSEISRDHADAMLMRRVETEKVD